jgi:twinkle protein
MAVMQAGLQNVVSVPCGDSDLEWISVCWDELEKCESINLWIDNDESGRIALPKIADRLGKHKIRVVKTEYKDANNMLGNLLQSVGQEKAYEAIWEAVGNAEWYWTGDLIEVADIEDDDQCFEGYASGIKYLDELTGGFYFYRMTVHIGSTKHGKSEGVNQFVANALELGAKVCVWTGEDSPKDYKYKIGIHFAGYDGIEQRVSKTGTYYSHITTEYKARVDEYMRGRLYLLDRRAGITEDAIVENFELAHRRHGCDVFVIDNLMKVVATKEADNTNHRQIQVVNKFSDFTKSYRVHGHLVAHTNKSGPTDEPPDRRNVSGASEIVNLADTVLGWWRIPAEVQEKYDHRNAWLGVLANRAHGDEGAINLTYDKRVRRFTSTDAEFHRRYSL